LVRNKAGKKLIGRRIIAVVLMFLAVCLIILAPLLAFTSLGTRVLASTGAIPEPTPTFAPFIDPTTPTPTPLPALVVHGPMPHIDATAFYLVDMDTDDVLVNINGNKSLPMASTTKIMTALLAIEAGNPNQMVPINQEAVDEALLHDGSNAGLQVGEEFPLKDMLYWLLLPSGDDAAVAIANALGGGSQANFVEHMNLLAYRLHLFQTHYADPDGLNWRGSPDHYSSAADLTHLAMYAMQIPTFAQIVKTTSFSVAATAQHLAHKCINTDTMLTAYPGMLGIKTGHTDAAGWCLVFAAEHNGHRLIGTILGSPSEAQRNNDVTAMLDWGFSLPIAPSTAQTGIATYC
jgi:D-alanyl-D-alanine carboxypeptidase (penicillin-binding protein 5/6)